MSPKTSPILIYSRRKIHTAPNKARISPALFSKLCFFARSISYSHFTKSKYSAIAVSDASVNAFSFMSCSVDVFSSMLTPLYIMTFSNCSGPSMYNIIELLYHEIDCFAAANIKYQPLHHHFYPHISVSPGFVVNLLYSSVFFGNLFTKGTSALPIFMRPCPASALVM